MKLHTQNFGGNLHQTASEVNRLGWAPYVLAMDYAGALYTVVVFRMPDDMVKRIRQESPSFVSDPKHDWPKEKEAEEFARERPDPDQADWIRVMEEYGPDTNRCAGGRIQARGYRCPHCASSDPYGDCFAPKKEN